MVILAMFVAIILIMAFTPVGLIDLPLIKATILHVPVIVIALLFARYYNKNFAGISVASMK